MENILNQINTTRGYFNDNVFEKFIAKFFINKYLYVVAFIFNWLERIYQLLFISSNYIVFTLVTCYWVYLIIKRVEKIDWVILGLVIILSLPIVNIGGISFILGLAIFIRVIMQQTNKWRILFAVPLIIEIIIKLI